MSRGYFGWEVIDGPNGIKVSYNVLMVVEFHMVLGESNRTSLYINTENWVTFSKNDVP